MDNEIAKDAMKTNKKVSGEDNKNSFCRHYDESPIGIIILTIMTPQKIIYINSAALMLVNYSKKQFFAEAKKDFDKFISSEAKEYLNAKIEGLLLSNKPVTFKLNISSRDNKILKMLCSASICEDDNNYILMSFYDVSEKEIFDEDAVNLKTIVSTIEGGLAVYENDEFFTIKYANDGFYRMLGYSKLDIKHLFKNEYILLIYHEDVQMVKTTIKEQLDAKNKCRVEYRMKKKNGDIIWVMSTGIVVKSKNSKSTIQCLITDISELKNKEEALLISEKSYELAMEFTELILFDYDIVKKEIRFHKKDCKEYNFPKVLSDAVNVMADSDWLCEDSKKDFLDLYIKIEEGAKFAKTIVYTKDALGLERIVELSLTTVFDSANKPVRAIGIKKDITEDVRLQREKTYITSFVSDKILTCEANITKDKVIYYNYEWADELGLMGIEQYSELVKNVCEKGTKSEHIERVMKILSNENILAAYEKGKRLISFEYLQNIKYKEYSWYEKTINIIEDEKTNDIIIRIYATDINEKKLKELESQKGKKYFDVLVSNAHYVYEVNITKNIFVVCDESWLNIYNISTLESYSNIANAIKNKIVHIDDREKFEETFSRNKLIIAYESGHTEFKCEYRVPNKKGEYIWVCCTMHVSAEAITGDIQGYAYINNVNEDKNKQLELIYKAEHDLLTGLYNKTCTQNYIDNYLKSESASNQKHVFLIIDIDRFKTFNDNFGHAFGDAILSSIASKIKVLFRDEDIVGRIGGDEFAVLMKNVSLQSAITAKGEEVCECVRDAFTQNNIKHNVSVSVGIAIYDEHGKNYEELYKSSDAALYTSKYNGRDTYTLYNEDIFLNANDVTENESLDTMIEQKNFNDNVSEYVFRILYESKDKKAAISAVLELVGKYFDTSRSYVFEENADGKHISNTFEWCNEDVEPVIDYLQNLSYDVFSYYKDLFNDKGILFLDDVNNTDADMKEILNMQGIKSMLQFSIVINGVFKGFIGFDECRKLRAPSAREISILKPIANILGVFVMEMRTHEEGLNLKHMALSIVNGLDSYAYVCDPANYEVLFVNEKICKLIPHVELSKRCYETFWNKTAPCDNCPMKNLLKGSETLETLEMYNDNLNIWVKATASWISWLSDTNVCLVESVDITEYCNRDNKNYNEDHKCCTQKT